MKIKKIVFAVLGLLCVGFGTLGIVVPVLPTFPLYLLAAFLFANSSEKLHYWFVHTGLYKKYLETYVQDRSMLLKTKIFIWASCTVITAIGFFISLKNGYTWVCVLLAIIWLAYSGYLTFGVKTLKEDAVI